MKLAAIAEQWLRKLVAGEIMYDPRRVESRWVMAAEGQPGRFQAILNENRKARLEKKAA